MTQSRLHTTRILHIFITHNRIINSNIINFSKIVKFMDNIKLLKKMQLIFPTRNEDIGNKELFGMVIRRQRRNQQAKILHNHTDILTESQHSYYNWLHQERTSLIWKFRRKYLLYFIIFLSIPCLP